MLRHRIVVISTEGDYSRLSASAIFSILKECLMIPGCTAIREIYHLGFIQGRKEKYGGLYLDSCIPLHLGTTQSIDASSETW